jgi:uncharacterized delta-60 repeat protein
MKQALLFFTVFFFFSVYAQDGTIDMNFDPGSGIPLGPTVSKIVEQYDEGILIAGSPMYDNTPIPNIVRVLQDGSIDTAFLANTVANGPPNAVKDILIQPDDNKIIVAGGWASPISAHLSRIDEFGNLDTSFNTGTGPDNYIYSIALQSDNKILIGGTFVDYDGNSCYHFARVTDTGAYDPTFNFGSGPNVGSGGIKAIAVQENGYILVGGNFTSFSGTPVGGIIRLKPDGTIDTTFVSGSGFNSGVNEIFIQADGQILISGSFTSYNGTPYYEAIRLNMDGSIDFSFPSLVLGGTSPHGQISLQQDQKIVVRGIFTSLNGQPMNNLGRLFPDGTVDCTFHSLVYNYSSTPNVRSCYILPYSNKLGIYGNFTSLDGIPRIRIAVLNGETLEATDEDYTITAGVATNITTILNNDMVYGAVANLTNATVTQISPPITGITFNSSTAVITIASSVAPGVYIFKYKLCATGTGCPDCDEAEVIINVVSPVNIVTIADIFTGTCINGVAGSNTPSITANDTMNGLPINSSLVTVALTSTGGLDGLTVNSAGVITIPPLTPVGTYIIYYTVTETANLLNTASSTATICINNGLNPGTGPNHTVYGIARQSDGKIIIVGAFTKYNNIPRNRIARLNPDLSLDVTFDANGVGFNDIARCVTINSSGQIIVGGDFTATSTGISMRKLAKLKQTSNPVTNGTIDTSFNNNNFYVYPNTSASMAIINTVTTDAGNNIFVGGIFHKVNNQNKCLYAKFNSSGVLYSNIANIFNSVGGTVTDIKLYGNKVFICGNFAIVSSNVFHQVAQLTSEGYQNAGFALGKLTGGRLNIPLAMAITGTKLYIAGEFGKYNSTSIKNIAQVNTNTGITAPVGVFNPGISSNDIIRFVELTASNNLIITGNFTTYTGTTRNRIAGLFSNGSIDAGFNPGSGAGPLSTGIILRSLIQPDGKIILGGTFVTYNGATAHYLTRVLGNNPAIMGRLKAEGEDAGEILSEETGFAVYPNPTSGMLTISLGDYAGEAFNVVVFNMQGQQVYEAGTIKAENNSINISHLQAGNYFVLLSNEKRVINKIVIKD